MKLDLKQLTTCLSGHLSAQDEGERLEVKRFTPKQQEHFMKTEQFAIRHACSAGIRLGFMTDARDVRIEAQVETHCRDWVSLDVEVDGHLLHHGYRSFEKVPHESQMEFPLGEDGSVRRVVLHLPQICDFNITSIELVEAKKFEPLTWNEKCFIAFGDSITQGMTSQRPSCNYVKLLSDLMELNFLNQGVGGHVFDPESFDAEIPVEPEFITVAYGTNDWSAGKSVDEITTKAAAYLAAIRERWPGKPLFVISPLWRSTAAVQKQSQSLAELSAGLGALCQELEATHVIDGLKLMPHDDALFADGLHPNDLGFYLYAHALWREISAQIK